MAQLERSAWPEVVWRWSLLTPSGFPIEVTVGADDTPLRWSCEIAGPELADAARLDCVASRLAEAGQSVAAPLLEALRRLQRGRELRYGAWLGGRSNGEAASRFKLYAEIPAGIDFDELPLPLVLNMVCSHAPAAAVPRMIGIEPARERVEAYLRLGTTDVEDLRPMLRAAGHPRGLEALDRGLPDGLRRLAGRRLGISFAAAAGEPVALALFASARSLFPGSPELVTQLVPPIARVPASLARLTLVTIELDHDHEETVSCAVGLTIP